MRLKDKFYAIKLRKQGKTHREIRERISNLSKGTLSGWLRYIELTPVQQKRVAKRANQGRMKARYLAAKTHRENRIKRMNETIQGAKEEVSRLIRDPLFFLGVTLYWCEGTQKTGSFSFINSDPVIIKIMIRWLNDICKIPKKQVKFRLYIHKIYAHEECEKFWSKELRVPLSQIKITYKPTPHKVKRNPGYKGCLKVDAGGVELFRKFLGWKEGTLEHLKLI